MPETIPLAIVGCGGMGHRHLYGLAELTRAGLSPFSLVGACDPDTGNASSLAEQATELLGQRPVVADSLEALAAATDVSAIDLTTTPRYHHTVAVEAFERGWHVMSEKPLGLTARACQLMVRAAGQHGKVLSTAENYRRDPLNRLGKALLDAGIIGDPRLMLQHTMGGGDGMLISVWRHQKDASGVLLDVGVHFADILEYYLGPAATVYAQTRLHEKTRKNPNAGKQASEGGGIYERWQKDMPAQFDATAEDAGYSTMLFESGAVVSYIEDHASRGEGIWKRAIFGSRGSMDLPGDRSGRRLAVHLPGQDVQTGASLLDLVPDFHLDEATAALFGGDRLFEYAFEFVETDRKLIAVEYADFGGAIQGKADHPEVDGVQGARSVAIAYAWMESQVAARAVSVDEVLADQTNAYQADINSSLGL
ncbi:MAG: Gfo/Idh/MocA family oxidoreductase [Gemmatimonadetes bacterium]|nr:Gfo/Idh/MocA family oxidoreductase [Gemmatimonadota bacterium]